MPIFISTLKKELKAAFEAEKEQTGDQDASITRIAQAIAEAVSRQIVAGISTATVTHQLKAPSGSGGGTVTGKITITANTVRE